MGIPRKVNLAFSSASSRWPYRRALLLLLLLPPLPLPLRHRLRLRRLRSSFLCRFASSARRGTAGAPTDRTRTGPPIVEVKLPERSGDPRHGSPRPTLRHKRLEPAKSSRQHTADALRSERGKQPLASPGHHWFRYSWLVIPARRLRPQTVMSRSALSA